MEEPPLNPIEQLLSDYNLKSAPARFIVISGITAGALYLIKPKSMFGDDGKPLPHATMPWYVVSIAAGGIGAVFI